MSLTQASVTPTQPVASRRAAMGLHARIFEQAARRPDEVAIRQWDTRITYAELCCAASRLAHQLMDAGVQPEGRVAVCTDRSPDMVTAVLGVLAAGACYVPVLPADPPLRRESILADSGSRLAVVDERGRQVLGSTRLELLDIPDAAGHDVPPALPHLVRHPEHAAYVLFTSGSTGRPKGVVVGHGSVANYALDIARRAAAHAGSVTIGYASLGFDASVIDIYSSLLIGAQLALLGESDRLDPTRTQDFLRAHRVSWGYLPPALLALLAPDGLPELSTLLVGGDTCPPEQVDRWTRSGRRLLNVYGPTETTGTVTMSALHGHWDRPVPIGTPTGRHRIYLLDADLHVVPDGEPGQIHIAGPGVARGYLDRPASTAAVYLPDPHGRVPGERMYATGDLAVRRADGLLYFLGRMDRQVKISGQRVELGEIEAAVRSHPDVISAVVDVLPTASGDPEVVAFLTPQDGPDLTRLREHLADRLPAAMTPTRLLRLPSLPMLSAAKVDNAQLRAQASAQRDAESARAAAGEVADGGAADGDTVDREVRAAWAAALGSPPSTPDEDFFLAGGHSLAAMRLVSRLRTALDRDLSVADVFTARTPAALRAVLGTAQVLAPETPTTGHPAVLGSPQRRLWFLDRLTEGTSAYNIALAQRMRGPLDPLALRRALAAVAAQHEVLRWSLPASDGQPFVEVSAPGPVDLPFEMGPSPGSTDSAIDDWLHRQATAGFDLAAGPLWRSALLRLGTEDHILALTFHHAIFDGWSVQPLYESLSAAYAGGLDRSPAKETASPAETRYADYVAWVQQAQDSRRRPMTQWWVDRLVGVPPVLDLPRDRSRPAVQTFRGSSTRSVLPAALGHRVRALSTQLGVTVQTVLLTAFGILLARLCGQRELIVGIPAADRRHPDFDKLVGFFVDTLPLPVTVDDEQGFVEHVRDVAATMLDALEHRDAPYEDIVDGLRLPRDLSRNPLVQVLFNVFDIGGARLQFPGIRAEPLEPGLPGSLFDLTLYVDSSSEEQRLQAVFNPDLYDEARIAALLDSYVWLLGELVTEPERSIGLAGARPAASSLPDPFTDLAPASTPTDLVASIAAIAATDPQRISISGSHGEQTYAQLVAQADAIAAALESGRGPVAILARRGPGLPAQLLGVLASGRQWLILDEALPSGWLAEVATAAGAEVLLCEPGQSVPDGLAALPAARLAPGSAELPTAAGAARLRSRPGPGYLMTTSGTSGRPAVVDTPRAPLEAFLDWYTEAFGLGMRDVTALLAGLGHDPMLRDVFTALRVGGRICIPDPALMQDPDGLIELLRAEQVTVLHLTPQLLHVLGAAAGALPAVRVVAMAGDRLVCADLALLARLCPEAMLLNGYGSTETPQIQALHRIGAAAAPSAAGTHPVPVGRGRPGVELHLATPSGRPAAVGELGRVLIRSRYLANGYLGEVPGRDGFGGNRFRDERGSHDSAGDRMFATGDLGRYTADGEVVLAGRNDDQVKIRGRRVGLGEVRAAVEEHESVREAVVTVHGEGDEATLVGYLVLHGRGSLQPLRTHLGQRLPDYARPTDLVVLPALPLTVNGKIDLAALPAPRAASLRVAAGSEPSTPTEKLIAGIWRDVLGVAAVGRTDSFFDIGGHSLAIVAVQARLATALDRAVRVVDLFRFPDIGGLAAHLDGSARAPGLDRAQRRLASRRARRSPSPSPRSVSAPPLTPRPPEDRP